MLTIDLESYLLAKESWENALLDMEVMQELLETGNVFHLNADEIYQLTEDDESDSEYFCFDLGVMDNQIILIIVPRDVNNDAKEMEEYHYMILENLTEPVVFSQIKNYTEQNIHLSVDLQEISNTTEAFVAPLNAPAISIEKAVEEIVCWKTKSLEWFSEELETTGGDSIFRTFFIPKDSILDGYNPIENVQLFLGLNENTEDGKAVATMLVLSQHQPILDLNSEYSYSSNSLNFARPCPPEHGI